MIPGKSSKKYKYLPRIRIDVFNNLKTKRFRRKKWRQIVSIAKRKEASPILPSFMKHPLSRFTNNLRYYYKNTIFIKLGFQLFYGGIQDFKLKAIMRKAYQKAPRNTQTQVVGEFDTRLENILYNINIVGSISEGRHHLRYERIYINNSTKKKKLKQGDLLHFSDSLRPLAERRLFRGLRRPIPFEIDFEPESIRFYAHALKITPSHPYLSIFRRLSRWYSI